MVCDRSVRLAGLKWSMLNLRHDKPWPKQGPILLSPNLDTPVGCYHFTSLLCTWLQFMRRTTRTFSHERQSWTLIRTSNIPKTNRNSFNIWTIIGFWLVGWLVGWMGVWLVGLVAYLLTVSLDRSLINRVFQFCVMCRNVGSLANESMNHSTWELRSSGLLRSE
jgi:hypothetical protein